MQTVHFRGSRSQATAMIREVIKQVTGKRPDTFGAAKTVTTAIGFAALSDIKDAYITKARGGVGEDGISWKDLSPKTKAYSRRGNRAALKKAAGLGRQHRHGPGDKKGLLTTDQLKLWRKTYSKTLARLSLSLPLGEAKGIAAGHAWNVVKEAGGKTMIDVFGNRQVEILRDTSVLFNSLSPGELVPSEPSYNYSPPENQVFEAFGGGVIVGTNVPYAGAHHRGNEKKKLPARPFWPEDGVPEVWTDRWWLVGKQALVMVIAYALRTGKPR